MDASKITELRKLQATRFIRRDNVVDSSVLTWKKQTQSSRVLISPASLQYSQGDVCNTCSHLPLAGVGSGTTVYSGNNVLYQAAGNANCGNIGAEIGQNVTLPACYCTNSNIGSIDANGIAIPPSQGYNPYLPIPITRPPLGSGCTNIPGIAGGQLPIACVYGKQLGSKFIPAIKTIGGYCCCDSNKIVSEIC